MNALKSLKMPNAEENHNVQALLNSTQEIEDRYKIFWRWWRVWRADVRAGWVVLGRFKVICLPSAMPEGMSICAGSFSSCLTSRTLDIID